MNITYKIAKLGAETREFFTENGDWTIADALALAGINSEGYQIKQRVAGSGAGATEVTGETLVQDKALITLVPMLKSGS